MQFLKVPVQALNELSPRAALLLGLIIARFDLSAANSYTDDKGLYCYYSIIEICDKLSISESQAHRHIRELTSRDYIIRDNIKLRPGLKINEIGVPNMTPGGAKYGTPGVPNMTPKIDRYKYNKLDSYPPTYDINLYKCVIDDEGGSDQ